MLAQTQGFSPAREDSVLLAGLFKKYQQQYKVDLDKIPSKNKKDLVELYQLRWKNIQDKFDQKEIFTDTRAQEYLDRLVSVIRQGNPSVAAANFSCYFSRSYIPNASYIGEGIILFNMGLFEKLDDESQVAFVLCHEIAHYLLQHSENNIRQYVAAINSEEVQAELRRIKGSAYGKREQLEKLVKGLTFNSRRHSRDHEAQADSMAVELMRNTGFALPGALSALALLDTIDKDSLNMSRCLPGLFNAPEYPFRSKWIAHDEGLLGGHAKINDGEMADSLKTHPDCRKRIGLLSSLMKGWSQPVAKRFVVDSITFASLRNAFHYETIEYAYLSDQYTESLFLTLGLLQTKTNDAYLITQVGRLLNSLYSAQKSHTLSRKTDLPSPGYPANYNLLLQFVQNLYLEDLAAISYYYLKQYHPQMDMYLPFRNTYQESEKLVKD
ncbi:MAG: M48 family metalloprotease [Bacteroidota bacterium]|nr:M48 family metalloprotease [Bacteroidota bacterium]